MISHDKVSLALLAFVSVLEAVNVGAAMVTGRPTMPAVDLLFTTTGGAVLTDALARRGRRASDNAKGVDPDGT